jgi:hypothetical protein
VPNARGSRAPRRDALNARTVRSARGVTQPLRERGAAMAGRVAAECAFHVGKTGATYVRAAVEAALRPRDALVDDDHDPRYLHPARTVLILLSDGGCRTPEVLAAAAFVESVDEELRAAAALADADAAVRALAKAVPLPAAGSDDLLERLVSADHDSALTALAERLDHARHLHLRPELPWREFHGEIETVYAPAAARFNQNIARRFDRWAEAFRARRLLAP